MGITSKFVEVNLFLVKMGYLYTVQVLLCNSNVKLKFLGLDIVNWIVLGSVMFCIAILIHLPSLSEMLLNIMCFSWKSCRKVFMGDCNVSLIIEDKNPSKFFQITHKTMALLILKITSTKHHLICLAKEKSRSWTWYCILKNCWEIFSISGNF